MSPADFDPIASALHDARTVVVASHLRPDADALGSTIAAALWLKSCGKEVVAWNEDGAISKFSFLPGYQMVTTPPASPVECDVVLALDNSTKKRLGSVIHAIAPGARWLNVDHHVSNEAYGDLNYIDPTSPATGQILVEFFRHIGVPITPDMAVNLFAAISTDTGSFQYQGTGVRTFEAASHLVACGVDVGALSREIYDSQPRRRFELLRHALNNTKFWCNDRIATFSLTMDDVSRMDILPEDNEGIIDNLRSIEGVLVAVFFEELPEGKVRVSARSKDPSIDVCKACQVFRGGGHPMAAGARVRGSLETVQRDFLNVVSDEIRKRD